MNEETSLLGNDSTKSDDAPPTSPMRISTLLQRRYPVSFYDPRTRKLMKDPVVAPGGHSYERSTWEAICKEMSEPAAPAYSNRALRQVIEETIMHTEDLRQSFRRSSKLFGLKVHRTVRQSMAVLAERSKVSHDDNRPALSRAFHCPITMSLMRHPVIGPEGYSFEKEAIERWIDSKQVSPLTRTPLPSKQLLYPNLALKEALRWQATKTEEKDLNQSARDFKAWMMKQPPDDAEANHQSSTYTGPNTLEEWQALRQQRKQSNVAFSPTGLLQLLYSVVLLVLGIVLGIVLGTIALIMATMLEFLIAPWLQCCCPGCCSGDSDPFGDDEVPFIINGLTEREEGD